MAFLRLDRATSLARQIDGKGLILRVPMAGDYPAWAELRAASRAHLTPWEPEWVRGSLTKQSYRQRLRFYEREAREDHGYAFLIFSSTDQTLLGGLSLSHVRRGVCQSAMLGYWLGAPFIGKGYMTRAVNAVLPFVFESLKLNRLEAATQPNNIRSMGVLERTGFAREGYLRRYLKINGVWEDHLLYARFAKDEQA